MFISIFNLSISCILLFIIRTVTCTSQCVYTLKSGQKLDIRPLGLDNGKGPKFDNIPNNIPTKTTLSWNGCFPYSKSSAGDCKDAAACTTDVTTGMSTLIAKQSNVEFDPDDNTNTLVYHTNGKLVEVLLTCVDEAEDTIKATQEDAYTFKIHLQSRCCCPDKCHYSGSSGSLSGGAIFIILLASVLFVYLVGGIIYMRLQRNATGLDMIPNRDMWKISAEYAVGGLQHSVIVIRNRVLNVPYQTIQN